MDSAALPMLDGLDVEALKALLAEQHAQYRAALNSNAQQFEHLKLTIEKLRRQLFGAKSEKATAQLEQLEFELDELQIAQACARTVEIASSLDTPPKSKPFRKPLSLKQFGEDVSE